MRDYPLVMIQSCAADRVNGRQFAGLDTWGTAWGDRVERKIILGRGNDHPRGSEIVVDAPDGYASIPWKIREAAAWAVREGYGYVFYCDVDTYVHVPRLLKTEFKRAEYIGYCCDGQQHASGGAGHWLGPTALGVLAGSTPNEAYGDLWIGHKLAAAGITLEHDARYWPREPNPIPDNFISAHLGRTTGGFDPAWMYDFHRRVMCS